MSTYFEVKVTYQKMLDNGKVKKVTEPYLTDALSCTEAEAVAFKNLSHITGEFNISQIKRTNYAEVIFGEESFWYHVKVNFITLNEKGIEKKVANHVLVNADSFESAIQHFRHRMKDTVTDYEIASVSETNIVDVYGFADDENEDAEENE